MFVLLATRLFPLSTCFVPLLRYRKRRRVNARRGRQSDAGRFLVMFDSGKKSTVLTYFLWLVGGVFGLHHIYLGRDAQAFIWWCTLGGYIGCGWIRDLFYIPKYVADVNEEETFVRKHVEMLRAHQKVGRGLGWSATYFTCHDSAFYLFFPLQ